MANSVPTLGDFATAITLLENTVNAAPQLLDADVTFTDPDDNFDGGTLVVSGLLAEDTVSIRNQGDGAGKIGLAGGTVSFGGVEIGTVSGGAGGDLTVTFNAQATSAAIEALIENLTYANASEHADSEPDADRRGHRRRRRGHRQHSADRRRCDGAERRAVADRPGAVRHLPREHSQRHPAIARRQRHVQRSGQ